MKSKIRLTILFVILSLFFLTALAIANEVAEKAARDSSNKWLSFVDKGEYSKSWERAAVLFRGMVTKAEWETNLNTFRTPLGKVSERNVKSTQYTKILPNAPEGEYVVIQYETTFKNKRTLPETVTCVLDKDGKWKIAGYYITFPTQESQAPAEKKKE